MNESTKPPQNQMLAVGPSPGAAFGVVLGLLLDNLPLGSALGLAIVVVADQARNHSTEDPEFPSDDVQALSPDSWRPRPNR